MIALLLNNKDMSQEDFCILISRKAAENQTEIKLFNHDCDLTLTEQDAEICGVISILQTRAVEWQPYE